MIRINLIPVKAAQKKEKLKGQLIVACATILVAAALCAAAYMQLLNWVQDAKDNVEQKKNEIVQLNKTIGEVDAFKKRQQDLRGKLDVLDKLEKSRRGPVTFLDELYKALPEKLWLAEFKEGGGNAAISGFATNEETVAVFMRNLEASPQFMHVALGGVQQMAQDGIKLHKFDLTCQFESQQPVDLAAAGGPKKN